MENEPEAFTAAELAYLTNCTPLFTPLRIDWSEAPESSTKAVPRRFWRAAWERFAALFRLAQEPCSRRRLGPDENRVP
jgi:hypothetical protein